MEWTTQTPIVEGYYWAIWDGLVYLVLVRRPVWKKSRLVAYFHDSDEYTHIDNPERHEFTHWMGPLEEPEKPG